MNEEAGRRSTAVFALVVALLSTAGLSAATVNLALVCSAPNDLADALRKCRCARHEMF
jgi:hypothetical protein